MKDEELRAQINALIQDEIQEGINDYIDNQKETEKTGLGFVQNQDEQLKVNIPNAEVDKLTLRGNPVELKDSSTVRVTTNSSGVINTGITTFSSTSHIKVPSGTTGQRPSSAVAGDFRYNTTTGGFEGYTDEWGAIAGGGGASETDTSVSSTSATSIFTTAHATNRSVSAIIQITQGSSYQVGRYLVIHDGTTATIVEESAVATGDMLGSFSADINNSNAELKVTMNSAGIATITTKIDTVTV